MVRIALVALAAGLGAATAAQAQIATPGGFARSGVAGPMTAGGGLGDRRNAGGGIPYVRLAPGGITRPAPFPRRGYYDRFGYGYGNGYGYGGGLGRGRAWVYDRPWERYPYSGAGYGPGYGSAYGPRYGTSFGVSVGGGSPYYRR